MLSYNEFLQRIIDDGIEAVKIDYAEDTPKMEGSIAGFEACRNLNPAELGELFHRASGELVEAHRSGDVPDEYWWHRCYQSEVEWVCNVVSAALHNQGIEPILGHLPTARGMFKAAEILGVGADVESK